jgi:formylmethanofuran:tetrahydromethanopterin formyltransferase
MTRLSTLTASLLISTCLAGNALTQESSALDAEIAAIESQITEVDATIARYDGGLIRALAESRREALLLLRTIV